MTTFGPCNQQNASATSGHIVATLGDRALTTQRAHAQAPTRMDGCDCVFSKFLEVCQDLAKYLNGHPKYQPNQHGMVAIQITCLDLNDHLGDLNDHPRMWPNQHGMMVIQISIVDLNDHLRPM